MTGSCTWGLGLCCNTWEDCTLHNRLSDVAVMLRRLLLLLVSPRRTECSTVCACSAHAARHGWENS